MKDYDGFSTDTTIVVSVAGRVVCVNENDGNKYDDYGFTEGIDNNVTYFNVTRDAYFSVSHEDGNTVCKDIENRPIYILNGDRLIKEYIYFEEYDNVSPIDPSEDPKNQPRQHSFQNRPLRLYAKRSLTTMQTTACQLDALL